jgi:hypothetical protein
VSPDVLLDRLIAALRSGEVDRVRSAWIELRDASPVLASTVMDVVHDMAPAALAVA